jgi:hypothetical protein
MTDWSADKLVLDKPFQWTSIKSPIQTVLYSKKLDWWNPQCTDFSPTEYLT